MKLIKRLEVSRKRTFAISIIALVVSITSFSIIFWWKDVSVLSAYISLFREGFFGASLEVTIRRTSFLFMLALAFVIPKKAGAWNVGGQGQFYLGMIGALGTSYLFSDFPSWILLPLMAIAAMGAGGVWGFIPGFLKGKWNVNEIISSLMTSYLAVQLASFLVVRGPWTEPSGKPESARIPAAGWFPDIGGTEIPYSVIIPIIVAIIFIFLFKKTTWGYETETVGVSPAAAKYSGMNPGRKIMLTMTLGGALAGFAGFGFLTSVTGYLAADIIPPWGFFAIAFGLFVGLDILATLLYSFMVTGLLIGGGGLTITMGMSTGLTLSFVGILFLINIILQVFRIYNIRW